MPSDVYSEEEKAALADPKFFKMFRRRLEHHMNVSQRFSSHQTTVTYLSHDQNVTQMTKAGSNMQLGARKEFYAHMMSILKKKPWIADYRAHSELNH